MRDVSVPRGNTRCETFGWPESWVRSTWSASISIIMRLGNLSPVRLRISTVPREAIRRWDNLMWDGTRDRSRIFYLIPRSISNSSSRGYIFSLILSRKETSRFVITFSLFRLFCGCVWICSGIFKISSSKSGRKKRGCASFPRICKYLSLGNRLAVILWLTTHQERSKFLRHNNCGSLLYEENSLTLFSMLKNRRFL